MRWWDWLYFTGDSCGKECTKTNQALFRAPDFACYFFFFWLAAFFGGAFLAAFFGAAFLAGFAAFLGAAFAGLAAFTGVAFFTALTADPKALPTAAAAFSSGVLGLPC
jgi:hypothetical protein